MQTQMAERLELHQVIDTLPYRAMLQAKGYIERLREEEKEREELEKIDAEIATLKAKYGTAPNAETREAIAELRAGKGYTAHSVKELMAALHNGKDD